MKSARTKACSISPEVKERVKERDGGKSILSGLPGISCCHYIPRSLGGLGIEENVVTLTPEEHNDYDNGPLRKAYGAMIKSYLDKQYPGFSDDKRIYQKYDY